MKKSRFNLLILLALFCILFSLASCGAKTVTWSGDTEYYAHVNMVVDETNLYEYVGAVDYVIGRAPKLLYPKLRRSTGGTAILSHLISCTAMRIARNV